MKILILNGPNLNLLGKREPAIYGNLTFEEFYNSLKKKYADVELYYFQSNIEGELRDKLHEVGFSFDGVILNAGAYTHTSVAIGDAIKGIQTPVIEVHISNVHAREEFRHHSYIAANAKGVIAGFGLKSYDLAIESFYTTTLNAVSYVEPIIESSRVNGFEKIRFTLGTNYKINNLMSLGGFYRIEKEFKSFPLVYNTPATYFIAGLNLTFNF